MSPTTHASCIAAAPAPRELAAARLQRSRLRDPALDRGDRAGFECMVASLQPSLRLAARRLAGDHARAEDLLQETLLRAWRFWPRYDERDNCRAWLQRILLNVFRSEHRRASRARAHWPQLEAAALAARAEHLELDERRVARELRRFWPRASAEREGYAAEQAQLSEPLRRGLARLSGDQRRVLWLVDAASR